MSMNPFQQASQASMLSVQQLQKAVQDGTLPPYIGIPLIQQKTQMSKEAQALAGGQQKPMPIAQQVMQEAQQHQGVQALPSGLPTEEMAHGGIVAFADGGMAEDDSADDYEDYLDNAKEAEINDLMDEYAQTFKGGIGSLPAAKKEYEVKEDTPDFIARIMHKESRGKRYDKEGKLLESEKGALGEMQVMPKTITDPGFGVKPAQSSHPDEIARVGRDYANVMLDRYKDPKLAAIAYNWGPGNTDKWLASGADMSKLPAETQGYVKGFSGEDGKSQVKEKGITYAPSGFGNTASQDDMTLEQLQEAKRLREMGLFDSMKATFGPIVSPVWNALTSPPSPTIKSQTQGISGIDLGGPGSSPANTGIQAIVPKPTSPVQNAYTRGQDAQDATGAPLLKPTETTGSAGAAPVATAPEAGTDRYSKFEDIFAQREANLAKQREQDKYMALLSAGLGMMGGTSPHALQNIGQGAQQGIQALMASNKDRTAEENALLSGRLGLAKIGGAKEQADAMMQLRRDIAGQNNARMSEAQASNLTEKQDARAAREQDKALLRLSDISKNAETQAEKAIAANPAVNFAADREAKKQAMIADILRRNAAYTKTYKAVHGSDADPFEGLDGTMPTGGGNHPKQIQSILDKYK